MSLFKEEEELGDRKIESVIGGRDKLPKTPDFKEWGVEPRKGSPFALDSFGSSAPANTTKP